MKRLFDLALSIILLIIIFVPMILIWLTIRTVDDPPTLFRQIRVGRFMKPFKIIKFRTMRTTDQSNQFLTVGDDPRITISGRLLRRYHLDELPQLFNIFLGHMSFIGPRPEIPEFVDINDSVHQQVYNVRPGLFDVATLHFLNEAKILSEVEDWREYYQNVILPKKLELSLNYIKTRSIKSDICLIYKIIINIFKERNWEEKKNE
jgi:lipopolysaccharide/colanic/teichoic acid biosynthesis glycosyltransferase